MKKNFILLLIGILFQSCFTEELRLPPRNFSGTYFESIDTTHVISVDDHNRFRTVHEGLTGNISGEIITEVDPRRHIDQYVEYSDGNRDLFGYENKQRWIHVLYIGNKVYVNDYLYRKQDFGK